MYFFLSKTIGLMANPLAIILLFMLMGSVFRVKKYKKWSYRLGVLSFLFFSNFYLANLAMSLWEKPAVPLDAIPRQYEVGIVLSGIVNLDHFPRDRTYFNKGVDRIYHAALLYQQKSIHKILITGGTGKIVPDNWDNSEALHLKQFLIDFGIPERDILLEHQGQNTFQNAKYSKQVLLDVYGQLPPAIIITSAFHMQRAEACFKKQGFSDYMVFPADYYGKKTSFTYRYWIPQIGALHFWQILIKEWVGILSYRVAGYL